MTFQPGPRTADDPAGPAAAQTSSAPQPAPPSSTPAGRVPAVLDGGAGHGRRHSLPRQLVGAAAVVAALLVVVALLRPDGPLDPPLPAARPAAVPPVASASPVPVPTAAHRPPTPGAGRIDGAPAAVRFPAPPPLPVG